MKTKELVLFLILGTCCMATAWLNNNQSIRLQAQAAEIEDLKWANSAVRRSKTLPKFEGMDNAAIANASYWTSCPQWVLAAIRRHENGPKGMECGYHGKTKFVVEHFPVEQWQYAEAGRFASQIAWNYCENFSESGMSFWDYFGACYTGPPLAKSHAWGKSIKKMSDEIGSQMGSFQIGGAEVGLKGPHFSPDGYSDYRLYHSKKAN